MGAERFIITTSVDGRAYRKIWKAGKPLTLGSPFNLRVCRTSKGVEIETLPTVAELRAGYEAQRRAFEFGDEVPQKGFDLRLRRASQSNESGLVVNILPAAGFKPVYESAHTKMDARLWGQYDLSGPSVDGGDPTFAFTCVGNVVQSFERLGWGFTGMIGGRAAFRMKRIKPGVYRLKSFAEGLEIKTPHRIFKLEKKAESAPLSESDLGQSVVCVGSSSWYFARCPIQKAEKGQSEKLDAETEWFRRAIQSAAIGFFTLMMLVATWPQPPKKIIQEIVETKIDMERPKEIVIVPPDPPKEPEPEPKKLEPAPEPPKPVEVKKPEPEPEPVKPKPAKPKPNAPQPKKAQAPKPEPKPIVAPAPKPAPAPAPAPKPAPVVQPKLAQTPEPMKAKPEPSPEQRAKAEAALRAEAARVAEAAKQAEIARVAEAQRQAEIRKTAEAKAKIGAALGFMTTAASSTSVKSGDYNKAGKEIAYAESAGTSELAKATGKSTAIGTLAKSGQGNGTIATRSGKQINGTALTGSQRGGGVGGKVHGKVRVGRGPGDGSFGFASGGAKVEGQGSISQAALEATMRRYLERFQYCYEKALLADGALSGNAVLSWTIDLQGRASAVSVVKSQLNNEGLHGCLGKEIKRIPFPKPEGGAVIVKYPFNFSSSAL